MENNQACYNELLEQFELIKMLCFEDKKNLVKIKSACHRSIVVIHYWKSGEKDQLRNIKLYTIELIESTILMCKNANNGKLMPISDKVSLCKPALQGINFFMLQAPDCNGSQPCED